MLLLLLLLFPVLGAGLVAAGACRGPRPMAAVVMGVLLAALLLAGVQVPAVLEGGVQVVSWSWLPAAGLDLALRADGLSLLFVFLVLGIGLLVTFYAYYYLPTSAPRGKFYGLLLLFAAAMLGVVLAENLLLLAVFWELTSLISFLLIGYWNLDPGARRAARLSLGVTGGGGLALLGGILLLGDAAGGYNLTTVLASGDAIRADPRYPWILGLVLLGVFTKSAQFPFHFWLPQAMSAPTPVSAYLHSATMVKAGVFLLARLYPALSGTGLWFWVVTAVGLFTLVFGAFFALFKHDLKGLLAYSTISHLGLITMLFGMGTSLSAVAGVFHIINHAIFKASLFMAAGIIEHESGSRDMRQLNGLVSYMPHTALLATVAAAAMAGVPLLNGFLSKEMFFAETLAPGLASHWQGLLPVAAVVSGIFAVAYSLRFIHDVFFNGLPVDLPRQPHEPPRWMRIPVEVLVGLCLLVGVAPHITVEPWLRAAAEAVVPGGAPHFDLALWHGFTTALFMSLAALGGGLAVYSVRRWIFHWHDTLLPQPQVLARFAQAEEALNKGGRRLLALLENGSLQRYVGVLFLTTLAVVALGWWGAPAIPAGLGEGPPPGPGMALNALAMALAAAATVGLQRRRLVALIWLGVVGLGVALVFVRFSAPDLALTQLAVEVVSVVLLLLALYFLPQRPPRDSSASRRLRDGLLAGVAGVAVGALVWGMLAVDTVGVGQRYMAESVPGTGGHNVVNAILVDFRGFDTLGEVTVLGIAAVGVFAMLRGFLLPPAPELQGRAWHRDRHPLVLLTISRPLLPVALLVSLYLLLRGHNAPGGGFVAGLITGIALILQYLASGTNWTQARLRVNYRRLLAAGLGTALVTGLIPWLWGEPFLTSAHGPLHLPLLGDLHWNTALLFDIGVYLTVVGAVTLILAELGWLGQKRRWHTLAEPEPKEGQPWPW